MSLRDELLPLVTLGNQLGDDFGVNRHAVTIRLRTWSGGAPGIGTATNTDLAITPRPKVKALSPREIASSGGTFTDGDLRIAPIPPQHVGGGFTPAQLQPAPAANQDVVVVLVDDQQTTLATIVVADFSKPFRYELVVRPRRETP